MFYSMDGHIYRMAEAVVPGRPRLPALRDPRLAKMMDPKAMPFDGKRMIYGGFKMMVDL